VTSGKIIVRATVLILGLSLLSCFLGLGREMAIANGFCPTGTADAFLVAYIIPCTFYGVEISTPLRGPSLQKERSSSLRPSLSSRSFFGNLTVLPIFTQGIFPVRQCSKTVLVGIRRSLAASFTVSMEGRLSASPALLPSA